MPPPPSEPDVQISRIRAWCIELGASHVLYDLHYEGHQQLNRPERRFGETPCESRDLSGDV